MSGMKRALFILVLLMVAAGGLAFYVFRPHGGKLPPEVMTALKESEKLTLYSIDFQAFEESSFHDIRFHGNRILGETVITSVEARRQVARAIQKGVKAWDGNLYHCFNPRHGLRVIRGAAVYDLLICFECQQIQIFDGEVIAGEVKVHETMLDSTGIGGPADGLNEILRAAHIPLEPSPAVNH